MAIKRREFLRAGAVGVAGLALGRELNAGLVSRLTSADSSGDRVIVVVNMYGGNDGLNTVVPLNQYSAYRALRQVLALPTERLLKLGDAPDFGLNPGLTELADLYSEGRTAIILGVGLPKDTNGLFDHAACQYVFQSCDTVRSVTSGQPSGWLGRFLDGVSGGTVTPGIDMGGGRLLVTGHSFRPVSLTTIDQFQLKLNFDSEARLAAYKKIMAIPTDGDPAAEYGRQMRQEALPQSEIIDARTREYQPAVEYPDTYFATQLLDCAKLINADVGIRAVTLGTGEYDTHSGQNDGAGDASLGYHDTQLKVMSDSIAAFYRDLDAHGQADRVLIMTISEFGRRAYENNDAGTDHGFGSVAFAIGKAVKGGVYGAYPNLAESKLVLDGNLDVTTDIRSVYATAVANFLGADPEPIVGGEFELLGFI